MFFKNKTNSYLFTGLWICFVFFIEIQAQNRNNLQIANYELDNGNFEKAIQAAQFIIERNEQQSSDYQKSLIILGTSQINLKDYEKAEFTLNEALKVISRKNSSLSDKKRIYFLFSALFRSQRKYAEAYKYSKMALSLNAHNPEILAEYYLSLGRIWFSAGYDISAIIWLEKAKDIFANQPLSPEKIDTYRFLSLASAAKLDYYTALKYAEQCLRLSEKSPHKYRYRQALLDLASILSSIGQEEKALKLFERGLRNSLEQKSYHQSCIFLTSLLLNTLYKNDVIKALAYLEQLQKNDLKKEFDFEITLGKSIIAAFSNRSDESERLLKQLDEMVGPADFTLLNWKLIIAEKSNRWTEVIKYNQALLDLNEKYNFRNDFPRIYLTFAKAYFHLNEVEKSIFWLEKSFAFIEEVRKSESYNLSLTLFGVYHDAYRLSSQQQLSNPFESFQTADILKARLLKDRINNAIMKSQPIFSDSIRQRLEVLTNQFPSTSEALSEIDKTEKSVTNKIPLNEIEKPNLSRLAQSQSLNETAIVSYVFTLDQKLLAYVWQKEKDLKIIDLNVSQKEAEEITQTTYQKIRDFLFFKKDGLDIYNKLLKPLNLKAKHLVIVPDKILWKLPFQALSSDGKTYLIENKTISYAPSVAILLNQVETPARSNRTFQVFANAVYDNKLLKYANKEALVLAKLFGSRPKIDATIEDFKLHSNQIDIVHFSMHAEVDNDDPINSFLSFKPSLNNNGRLTVEDLLGINLKKGSLAFIASCETNNILDGEGLVSLSWGMMGAGATTVISAQWEADDEASVQLSQYFYRFYNQNYSVAESMQKASIEMIRNSQINMTEPYYWAVFTINGDFR